jgi:hypothetical protein
MKIIETTTPISIENLKEYFADNDVCFLIDYENSTLRGNKLLTYLSNLEIPCDIKFSNDDDLYELIVEYFNSQMLLNIDSLEKKALEILLQCKYEPEIVNERNEKFIEENIQIISKWISLIESLTVYNMFIIKKEETQDFVKIFPVVENDDLRGINFVSLLKHEIFYDLITTIDPKNLLYYKEYFENNVFKGKNLFEFWSNEKNILFLLTFGMMENIIKVDENGISEIVESK